MFFEASEGNFPGSFLTDTFFRFLGAIFFLAFAVERAGFLVVLVLGFFLAAEADNTVAGNSNVTENNR